MYVLRVLANLRPLREPDTGGTGGNGNQQPGDERQNLQGLLQRHNNDAMAVVATLLAENHGYRERIRTLNGQLPAQGAVVLTAEQAQQWQSYAQLGTVEQLTQQREAAQKTVAELSGLKREKHISEAAQAVRYKPTVLAQLPGAADMTFEARDVTADGKTSKVLFAKDKDGKELSVAERWPDFLAALPADTQQQQPAGTTYVRQDAGGAPPAGTLESYAKRFQEQRDGAPNPLAPKSATSPVA